MGYNRQLATKLRITEEPLLATIGDLVRGNKTFYAPVGLSVLEAALQCLVVRTWHELAYKTCSFGDGNVCGLIDGDALREAVEAKLGTDEFDIAEIMDAMRVDGGLNRRPEGWAHSMAWETPDYWHLEEESEEYCSQWRPGSEGWALAMALEEITQ